MDYSFVRRLVKNISETDADKIFQRLYENGIEVFGKKKDVFSNVTLGHVAEYAEFYVSAADLETARILVEGLGLGQYLCSKAEAQMSVEKSEVEKAEEEFYRKHKQNQIFAWAIIFLVIVFMVVQFFRV
jgi:hypothetical protein